MAVQRHGYSVFLASFLDILQTERRQLSCCMYHHKVTHLSNFKLQRSHADGFFHYEKYKNQYNTEGDLLQCVNLYMQSMHATPTSRHV